MRCRPATESGPDASCRGTPAARASACSRHCRVHPSCPEEGAMKASAFAYHDPRTLDDLVGLLAALKNAKLLAGGQSLMPMLNLRLVAPDHLVDINRIPELAGIRLSAEGIELGAMTRQSDLQESQALVQAAPIFAMALAHVGHFQSHDPAVRPA